MNTTTNDTLKAELCAQLRAFINQRSGLEWRNYVSGWNDTEGRKALNADRRRILNDGKAARTLLTYVEASSLSGETLKRELELTSSRLHLRNGKLEYITGQYFAVEYRRAVAAFLAAVVWGYWAEWHRERQWDNPGVSICDKLRKNARLTFGRTIAQRFFA